MGHADDPDQPSRGEEGGPVVTIQFRLASFNCENLFRRPRIFSTSEKKSQQLMAKVAQLETELRRPVFDHALIKQLEKDLEGYITINDVREKHTTAEGAGQWLGWIEFKKEPINGGAIHNTARVIFDLDADVVCLMEIEDRLGLQRFHDDELVAQFLAPKHRSGYEYVLLIDGNDERGIDVAVMSRRPVQWLRSHINERTDYTNLAGQTTRVPQFSRDCLEVHIGVPNGQAPHLLATHLTFH